MADPTFEAERLAEIMARVNEEMRLYGEVTPSTTDAMMKAKHGINNFTAGTAKAADVVGNLAGAAASAGKAMLDGKKGAAAFNESVDGMASAAQAAGAALALMVPGGIAIKLLIAGVTAAVTAFAKYTKEANEMADKLSKGYQGLAKSGAAAADGMTGLYRDAKKLGLSMNELDQMVSLVAENAKDFALFAGSVSEGRKRFADLSETMKPARTGLMNLGMNMEEINAASAGYLRLQSRIGQTQNKTTAELAEGTKRYLYEQDALTKLTGQTRKEQEAAREEIRAQERFAAVLQQMRAKGQVNEAKALEDSYLILRSQSKEAAQGFADISTGNLQTEAAQKSMLATQGGSMEASQRIQAGQLSAAQGAQQVAEAYGRTADQLGNLGIVGQFDKTFGSLSDSIKLGAFAQGDINKQYEKILEDQKKQAAGQDALVANQTKLVQTQMEANKAMEDFISKGINNAQKQMIALADATKKAAETLDELTPGGKKGTAETIGGVATGAAGAYAMGSMGAAMGTVIAPGIGTAIGAALGGLAGGAMGYFTGSYLGKKADESDKVPKAAEGGMLTGPTSGYLAMLHGTEMVIPENMLKGQISTPGAAGGLIAKEQAQIDLFTKDILKDTELLAKLTDSDAKRTQDYSRTQKKLIELKVKLMGEEIDILEEQNKAIEEMANVFERSGGQGGAAGFKKMMRMQNLGIGGGSAMGGGAQAPNQVKSGTGVGVTTGTGLPLTTQPPAGSTLPEGMSATGSAKTNIDNLLAFGDRSGSKANFEALDDAFQNAVTKAAEEYNSVTGKKIKINSATRDPADQERIYAESVAAGRPGISPTGMPIGKPGTSRHERGLAIDIQNYTDPQAVAAFNRQGLFQKVPNDPVHFQFEEGGVASGPRSGYGATLHGDEAVIPLNNGAGNFVKMFESMAESNRAMVSMMQEMVSAQKNSVDVQQKMLRMAS
jgi:hypothetical protein